MAVLWRVSGGTMFQGRVVLHISRACVATCFRGVWCCMQCKTAYDMVEIEHLLVDALQRKAMASVLQDLKCTKCKGVSRTYRA